MERPLLGSAAWLEATGGRLTSGERARMLLGAFGFFVEGYRLARRAKRGGCRNLAWDPFEPPATPMVQAARAFLERTCVTPMVNHAIRTGYWTAAVLQQNEALEPPDLETAWVAALLHDVGLDVPSSQGDFSTRGIEVLKELALTHRWPERQVHFASDAIATNLASRVNPTHLGKIAWAMNVGGAGEIGFRPHRSQLAPGPISALELRYPRTGFRETAVRLLREEARRVPGGRFALMRHFYPLFMPQDSPPPTQPSPPARPLL